MAETKTLQFDDGLLRLDINGNGILTFNPSDFNVYQRFFGLLKELPELEKRYAAEVEQPGSEDDSFALAGRELDRARELDREIKDKLGAAFGPGNDFVALLGGVNLMAVGNNGQRVITNLLNALAPYIEEGAKRHQQEAAEAALRSRAQRRAVQQG